MARKMKTRLQALVVAMAMLSVVCGSLSAVCADGPAQPEVMPSYRASDYFDISANPYGKDGKTPWQWEYYDSYAAGNYESAKYTVIGTEKSNVHGNKFANQTNYPHPADDTTGAGLRRGDTYGTIVGKYWMGAEMEDSVIGQYYAVRTFVAPEGGTVTITTDNQNGGKAGSIEGTSYTAAKVQETENRGVRIVLEKVDGLTKVIWPKPDTPDVYTYTDKNNTSRNFMKVPHGKNATALAFAALGDVTLSQGDKLHFELANLDPKPKSSTDMSKYGAAVYWDPVVSYTEIDSASEMPAYQASREYVVDSNNSPTAHWAWEYYDTETDTYALLEGGVNATKFLDSSYSYTQDVDTGHAFKRNGNDNASTAIGKYWMAPDMYENAAKKRYYAVRTFTVPKTGNISITAAGIAGRDSGKIYGQVKGTGNGGKIRITLEDGSNVTKIWPEDDWQVVPRSGSVSFAPMNISIKRGQKLHFEVADSVDGGSSNWDQAVCWDPIVSYNSFSSILDFQPSVTDDLPLNQIFTITTEEEMEPVTENDVSVSGTTKATVQDFCQDGNTISFAFDGLVYNGTYEVEIRGLKPVGDSGEGEIYRFTFTTITLKRYQASDYYGAGGKSNPHTVDGEAPWTWESYDRKTKTYTPLSGFNTKRGYAIVGGWDAVTAVDNFVMYGDTRQDGQGGYQKEGTYTYAWQRYYPVRTFTVSQSGNVTITADDGQNGDRITTDGTAVSNLRILLERDGEFTQLWPEEGWKAVSANAPVNFAPMAQNVIAGDKLHFELSAEEATTGSCWQMRAYWDPVVTYNEKHPTVTEISPEDGAVDVPGNTEFVVTFDKEICEPTVQDAEIDGGAAVAEVWSENGNEVHIRLNSATLKEKTAYTLRLKNIRLKTIDEPSSFEQCITFTTADYTVFGEFSRSGEAVVLPINNTLGESYPVTVTMIAALCQGTPEHYTIKSARYKTEVITGKCDMTVALEAAPESGEFVKAVIVTAPDFGKLLMDMAVLN